MKLLKHALAILSPNENAYSETFIQAHKRLPFPIKFYYGGAIPCYLNGKDQLYNLSYTERIEKKILRNFNAQEYALYFSLKRENVGCVLVEYGTMACENLKVIKALNLPMIVHFHGFDASENASLQKYAGSYPAVFEYAHTIIVVSKKMKEKLMEIGCSPDKILLSVYGPNSFFFENIPKYLKPQFVSVGRFTEKKAPHLTILAFKKVADKFPDVKMVMVGDGELLSFCKDVVAGLELSENIEFKGVLSPEKIKVLFKESFAFVQHSVVAESGDSEGTPVAILEAQAAALPVVSTYHAGIPDVVMHGETGFLVKEHDVQGMADYMCRLLNDTALVTKMGCKGRKRINEFFTMEKHLNALAERITEAINNHKLSRTWRP